MSRHWIFLRGLGRHAKHWGSFVDEFRKTFPEDQIEFLDLRGNGEFAHSPSLISIQDNVRDLRSRSLFLRDEHPIYLMTISMGAMVGIEWAHTFPHEIAGLVTINTSDRGSSSFFERLRPGTYPHLARLLALGASPLDIETEILKITTNRFPDRKKWAETFARTPATARSNWLRQLWAASSYIFPDHHPKTEILMLASLQDRLVNSICTQNIAEMWS
ncbi:MAG: alpha/beta hydrolase, partial [Pseudobdellovibrionaceae bacterium]